MMLFDLLIESAIDIFGSGFTSNDRGHSKVIVIGGHQVKRESWGW
jgi:hypothetical protein